MTTMSQRVAAEKFLPLQSGMFYILTALGEGPLHGYGIIQDIAKRTGGEVKISAATLYRSIQRMQEDGLLVESKVRPSPEKDDERRIYYEITTLGSQVLQAELARLSKLIKLARTTGFAPSKA